ncbi:MAG: hypothetical protein LGB54_04020 [Sulfurovum sp.]|nr:hypothetical protein [Sulfurovum sp.]
MRKVLPKVTLLIISIASPLMVGVYENNRLVQAHSSNKKTSEILLPLLNGIFKQYNVKEIIYTREPGSYMATKLTYITLKTIEILRGIQIRGCSAFSLNGGKPIKAIGSLYFIKEKETIMTKKLEEPVNACFALPYSIQDLAIDEESTPEYLLPAV